MSTNILNRARPDIVSLSPYSSARSKYKNDPEMVLLDANECAFDPFIGGEGLSRYPSQQPDKLVDVICRLYDVSSQNLAMTRGADESIDCLIRAFCSPQVDNIIICPPTFPMYKHSALLHGANVKEAKLKSNYSLDKNEILKQVDDNTKIIFICSPNNPTANVVNRQDILSVCKQLEDRALVVVDETYIEYAQNTESLLSEINNYKNLTVLRTLSKSYAAAGLRCGFTLAQKEIIGLVLKILPPYPLPQPMVQAALKIFNDKNLKRLSDKRQDIIKRKKDFIETIKNLKVIDEIYPSDANFLLVRLKDSKKFIQDCLDQKIIVRDQSSQKGLENCVRFSIGTEEEMQKLLQVMKGEKSQITKQERTAIINRVTNETKISLAINLDKSSPVSIQTGIGFYDHMLEQIAKHGGFSIKLECEGDLKIDSHHTIEDCAIAFGQGLKTALGDKQGIGRYGFSLPMDESKAEVLLDLSGRTYLKFSGNFPDNKVGEMPTDMVEHVFRSLAENLQANLHISVEGENTHHMVEACFKAFGRSLRQAIKIEGQDLPSTKGML